MNQEQKTKNTIDDRIFKGKIFAFLNMKKKYVKRLILVLFLLFIISFIYIIIDTSNKIKREFKNIHTVKINNSKNIALARRVRSMTFGYPMEKMIPYISHQDEQVAAFLVAIAKKESNWGKRSPKLNGQDCYNYWGFRQKRESMGTGGHTCFDSPKDAVNSVSKRIKNLIAKGVNTPQKMVLWKCGYSCAGHSSQSVKKWISDVNYYYNKF